MKKPMIAPLFKDKPNFRGDTFILQLEDGREVSFFSESSPSHDLLMHLDIRWERAYQVSAFINTVFKNKVTMDKTPLFTVDMYRRFEDLFEVRLKGRFRGQKSVASFRYGGKTHKVYYKSDKPKVGIYEDE